MSLAVVLDLLVALDLDFRAILQHEPIAGIRQILLLHQHALERLGVEAEGGAALELLFIGVEINVLEILVGEIGGDIRRLGDAGIHPLLCSGLNIHMLARRHVVGGDEILRQPFLGGFGVGHGLGIDQMPVGQQFEGEHVHLFLGFSCRGG